LKQPPPAQVAQLRSDVVATPVVPTPVVTTPAASRPASSANQPAGSPRAALAKETPAAGDAKEPAEERKEKTDQKASYTESVAVSGRQVVAAQAPQASPLPAETRTPRQKAETTAQSATQGQVQVQSSGPAQQGSLGGISAGRVGAVPAASPAFLVARRARFAFDYSVEADRNLVIKVAASGYLSVAATPSKSLRLIFPTGGDGNVGAGSITRIAIPPDVQSVAIVFSTKASSANDATAHLDSISAVKDSPSGTVEDPNPSPNSRLALELKIP